MKLGNRIDVLTTFFISVFVCSSALAQLTVQDPTIYGTKSGYIDNATVVVEPHGAFVEQSLYLQYSDHNQYPGNQNIEIVQRFTLPDGAVVDNLWLWIGDTLVEAKMFSTWTARHIYDSIVVRKHDPAFLAKNGNTYELHIYPLVSGQSRRTRIDFIVPTRWLGNTGFAELPFALLSGNNAQTKPLKILFRERENIWGTPSVRELPQLASRPVVNSAGYKYSEFDIPDISPLPSLSVEFHTDFNNGLFAATSYRGGDSSYFQIGVDPGSYNVIRSDTGAMSTIVGLDLSGNSIDDVASLIPKVGAVLHHALRPIDRFRLVVAGNGTITNVSDWRQADSTSIDAVLGDFAASSLATKISSRRKLKIVFCDDNAGQIWNFPSLAGIAYIDSFTNIVSASTSFGSADIIASYDHGFESAIQTNENLSMLFPKIDSLFYRGGRFVGYFDHNRPGSEKIETHYVNGLTENYPAASQTLYAQPGGNIGSQFPPSITVNSVNYLTFDDPGVKVELANSKGEAAVISKRIGNGLLVVSGIWSFQDDGALKQTIAVPLLGISQLFQGPQLVKPLLDNIRTVLNQTAVKEVLLFSNSDSVVSKTDASNWASSYLTGISGQKPVFHTINLLDGSRYVPPYVSENGTDYYGAGYLQYCLSKATGGLHFETHLKSWDFISGTLTYSKLARMDSLKVSITADAGAGSLIGMREVDPEPNDAARPKFFIGITDAKQNVSFDVKAAFQGSAQVINRQDTSFIAIDTTRKIPIIAEILGWEELNDLFNNSSLDTSTIVNLALRYNLLCDYTALIALEPKTETPGSNGDNGGEGNTPVLQTPQKPDTVLFGAYPNPFNPTTTFYLSLRAPSEVKIVIYNLLGQKVRTLTLSSGPGTTTIVWDGRDSAGRMVASGVYFARAIIVERSSSAVYQRVLKLLMLK